MGMDEVSVGDLSGPALDWAVATVEGLPIRRDPMAFGASANGGYWIWEDGPNGRMQKIGGQPSKTNRNAGGFYSPSTDWNTLGPLILKFPIVLGNHESGKEDGQFWGSAHCFRSGTSFETHKGVMVAACRAIVAYALGVVVKVPADLITADMRPSTNSSEASHD
ncbi:DUF2591 domain-containing protein [Pseudomonas putida]|uniref:phage protein NinX family protein n=1 Tax=Pseudomonas putida TaxID=303 RepID=UPI0023642CB1|nr:phage protein NinX family protein [Pseudomonas putida]MDD2139843.1 DUF2591 domain-containing protein [Pseudomonas putida]HDS1721766.1 DUF2591 family protein [Pseudomonas putida]